MNDRLDGACGGIAIIVLRRIKHQLFSSFETKFFETLDVSIEKQLGKYTFKVAYLHCQCIGQQGNLLQTDSRKLIRSNSSFLSLVTLMANIANEIIRKVIPTADFYLTSALQDIS